ncbi:ADP-ribosylation factor 1, putative (macronuclear) [Tetrahymena thermophila SB210]|uniref:ADP-ribosylation factor 1, putative n=1 Tax=Tetrahymena thermophila (strain SB210) TaxID=312017 RepID=Q22FX2_TETTS|nr:ADP-ribosylation factor 1, putative [Tetrahymena thermophila SB210]EAR84254.1 ADP-ribosylation factor 1, putative [Tetrahymena thermophila SB210]|eukprot:XP_001031917.1 ADP-ribosylation factor 1, putative [Tetrahymena thermophila SB210]
MGQQIQKAIAFVKQPQKRSVCIFGLDQAGKTTILYYMKDNKIVATTSQARFNFEVFQYQDIQFKVCDLQYNQNMRLIYHHYYSNCDAIVFVIDSSDSQRFNQAKEILEFLYQDQILKNIPLLVLANKQDIAVLSIQQIQEDLQLNQIQNIQNWHIQGCSSITGQGIKEGFNWLVNIFNSNPKNKKK